MSRKTSDYQGGNLYDLEVTIEVGETDSTPIDLHGTKLMGLRIPSDLTATSLKILSANALDGTYILLEDGEGAEYEYTATASKQVKIEVRDCASVRYLKLRGTTQTTTDAVIGIVNESI